MTLFDAETMQRLKDSDYANPMVYAYGKGPTGKKCRHCRHLYAVEYANRYLKCAIRGNSGGKATDHKAGYAACSRFESK